MLEIATLKTKKISDLQKIAEEIGLKNFKDLKKTDLIYQIIDQAASKKDSTSKNMPDEKKITKGLKPNSSKFTSDKNEKIIKKNADKNNNKGEVPCSVWRQTQ